MLCWNSDPDALPESPYLRFSVLLEDMLSDLYEVELPAQEKPGSTLSPSAWVMGSHASLKCHKNPLNYWVLWISLPFMFCPEIQGKIWSLSVIAVPKQGHICKLSLSVPKCTILCHKNQDFLCLRFVTQQLLFCFPVMTGKLTMRHTDKHTVNKTLCKWKF